MSGAMTAPMFAPALKIPVARARSRRGNHSATVLMAAGKFPRLAQSQEKPRHAKAQGRRDQSVRCRGNTPPRDYDCVSAPGAHAVHEAAH